LSSHQATPLTPEELAEFVKWWDRAKGWRNTSFDVEGARRNVPRLLAAIAEQAETIARLEKIEERAKEQLAGYESGRYAKQPLTVVLRYVLHPILEGEKPLAVLDDRYDVARRSLWGGRTIG
jgi:hypothetical protein